MRDALIDYSIETASWQRRVQDIQQALRERKYATALAKVADLQASLVRVDAWIQDRQEQQSKQIPKDHAGP